MLPLTSSDIVNAEAKLYLKPWGAGGMGWNLGPRLCFLLLSIVRIPLRKAETLVSVPPVDHSILWVGILRAGGRVINTCRVQTGTGRAKPGSFLI